MPSVNDAMNRPLRVGLLALAVLIAGPVSAQGQAAPSPSPSRQEVQQAHDHVQQDPNLGGTRKEQKLRFKDFEPWKPKPTKSDPPSPWLLGLARWIAEAGRLVIWAVGALAVALFIVGLRYWIRARAEAISTKTIQLPSHVRELDIRPESLPDRIGATARELWLAGQQEAALSLLYRGTLSRLVHVHAVPIRAASTEGECVHLARRRLDPARGDFVARLVGAWQLAIYGARMPDSASVLTLCDDFDAQLGHRGVAEVAP